MCPSISSPGLAPLPPRGAMRPGPLTLAARGALPAVLLGAMAALLLAGSDLRRWLVAGLAALPLHVAAHQLGHALAAALVRFRVGGLRAGPILLERRGRSWRAVWQPLCAQVNGLLVDVPGGGAHLRLRMFLFAAGGPIANLAVAAGCAVRASAFPPGSGDGTFLADLLLASAWVGLLAGLVNLLPFRLAGTFTPDGVFLALSGDRSEAARLLFGARLASARGLRPGALGLAPGHLLALAERAPRHADALRCLALLVALDQGDAVAAHTAQARLLERWRKLTFAERNQIAFLTAFGRALDGQADTALDLIRTARERASGGSLLLLLDAAAAAARGHPARARVSLGRWQEGAARSYPASVGAAFEWVAEALRARLDLAPPAR